MSMHRIRVIYSLCKSSVYAIRGRIYNRLSADKLGWDKLRLVDYEMKFNQYASAVQIRDATADCEKES